MNTQSVKAKVATFFSPDIAITFNNIFQQYDMKAVTPAGRKELVRRYGCYSDKFGMSFPADQIDSVLNGMYSGICCEITE